MKKTFIFALILGILSIPSISFAFYAMSTTNESTVATYAPKSTTPVNQCLLLSAQEKQLILEVRQRAFLKASNPNTIFLACNGTTCVKI